MKLVKQEQYNQMLADDPFKKKLTALDGYYDGDDKEPKIALELVIREIDYQINKCKLLIVECERSPRYKFILDFDEVYWLYN